MLICLALFLPGLFIMPYCMIKVWTETGEGYLVLFGE
jgi:hypothetical protein